MKQAKILILTLIFALITGCSSGGSQRHRPSDRNSTFSYEGNSFAEYINHSRRLIAETRTDLAPENREERVEGNAPFLLIPGDSCPGGTSSKYRRGILLVHGLTDSPYDMRALARFFQGECFYVQALLLPGHGTRPGDLLEVTGMEWVKAYSFGVETLKRKAEEVYLGGFSTGGTLAVHHALKDDEIRGLFLFSPAVEITKAARWACWLAAVDGIFPIIGWLGPLQPDDDPYKYESFTANAACQVFRLTKEIEKSRSQTPLAAPLFVAASADDATVHTAATIELFHETTAKLKKMILYARRGMDEPAGVELVDSSHPDKRIASSAHTAIVIPPEDGHYGSAGDYAFCTHYYQKDDLAYSRCKERREDLLGEISGEFLRQGVVRRLTYNPGYDDMLKQMRTFISTLSR
jgi:esterase/lipase